MKTTTIVGIGAVLAGIAGIVWYFLQPPTPPEPPECVTDADCPEGYVCVNGICVLEGPECVTNADCPTGYICVNGVCVPESGKGTIGFDAKDFSQHPPAPFPGIKCYADSQTCTTATDGKCTIQVSPGTYSVDADWPPGYYPYIGMTLPYNVEVVAGYLTPVLLMWIPLPADLYAFGFIDGEMLTPYNLNLCEGDHEVTIVVVNGRDVAVSLDVVGLGWGAVAEGVTVPAGGVERFSKVFGFVYDPTQYTLCVNAKPSGELLITFGCHPITVLQC